MSIEQTICNFKLLGEHGRFQVVAMVTWLDVQVDVVDWHMDDARIGEGRKETEVFTEEQIEKMGEKRI